MDIGIKLVGGGLLALIALALAKMIFAVVAGFMALVIAITFKVLLIALCVWAVVRLIRYLRRPAYND